MKDRIGLPALLECTAEECLEFAHACLKYARKLRNDNPTPIVIKDIKEKINEELADLTLCIDELWKTNELDSQLYEEIFDQKSLRWRERLDEFEKEKKND